MRTNIGGGLAMQMRGTSVHRWECEDDGCQAGETRANRAQAEVEAVAHAAETGHDILIWKLAAEVVHVRMTLRREFDDA